MAVRTEMTRQELREWLIHAFGNADEASRVLGVNLKPILGRLANHNPDAAAPVYLQLIAAAWDWGVRSYDGQRTRDSDGRVLFTRPTGGKVKRALPLNEMISELRAAGWGYKSIGEEVGVLKSTVYKWGQGTSKVNRKSIEPQRKIRELWQRECGDAD